MPQWNLLQPGDDPIGFRVEWVDRTPDLIDGFDVTVYMRRRDGDWTAVVSQRWSGLMLDFACTFTTDVTSAWLWGDRRDVVRAAASVERAARVHAREHAIE